MAVNPIPEGYPRVMPYVSAEKAGEMIDFMVNVLDGKTDERMEKDGLIMHAEVRIGDSVVMCASACEQFPARPTMLYVYVPDVDATYKKALEFGAESVDEPKDQFYGDRSCMVRDSSGNNWGFATHVEDIAPEELQKRAEAAMKQETPKAEAS